MTAAPGRDGAGVTVVVPTYNERDNVTDLVSRLHAALPGLRVLVVDDDSPDGTGALADALAARDPRVAVLHHGPRKGLGAAYLDGFARVLAHEPSTAWVVQMDADGSHAPEELGRLLHAVREPDRGPPPDVVLGSRYVRGGRIEDWALHRRLLSWAGNAYSRSTLDLPVQDVTGGYRLFRRSVVERLDAGTVSSHGYCFQVDMAFRAVRSGATVREVPITFAERTRGTSKMSPDIVREALWRVTVWAARERVRRFRARPRRR